MLVLHLFSSNIICVVLSIPISLMWMQKEVAILVEVKLFASCFKMNHQLIFCIISVVGISYYAERRIDKIPDSEIHW
jgi:hypothetical protein